MADTSISDPATTGQTETKGKFFKPPAGAVGWEGFLLPSEQSLEVNEGPKEIPLTDLMELPEHKPSMPSSGSIPFNSSPSISVIENPLPEPVTQLASDVLDIAGSFIKSAPSLTSEIGGSIGDLAKDIFGLETQKTPDSSQEQLTPEDIKAQVEAREIRFVQNKILEFNQARSAVEMAQFMKESLRITGGTPTEQDADLLDVNYGSLEHLKSRHLLMALGEKREEIEASVEEQQRDAVISSPAKPAYAVETQFEGGSGKFGLGTASLSSASGAVG